jgi:hypothetical protein
MSDAHASRCAAGRARQTTPPSGALRPALAPANSQSPAPALAAAAGGSKIPVRAVCFTRRKDVLRTQGFSAMQGDTMHALV